MHLRRLSSLPVDPEPVELRRLRRGADDTQQFGYGLRLPVHKQEANGKNDGPVLSPAVIARRGVETIVENRGRIQRCGTLLRNCNSGQTCQANEEQADGSS